MSTSLPSVKDTYFQDKVLSRIHGKPIYETLQTLATKIKANVASVPSTLEGCQYGHLGLILFVDQYATLANTNPWVSLPNPGPFAPPANGTGPQLDAAKDVWRELRLSFDFRQATEKALIAQIVESIDPIYLWALLNHITGQYSTDVHAVLLHLFTTHGKITPHQVKAKEMSTLNMHYDISLPVDTAFNAIDDLIDLAEHALSPMLGQMIDLANVIFARQPILQQDLCLWNCHPTIEHTWANMLQHFRNTQSNLSYLPTALNAFYQRPFHQANAVAEMADLVAQRLYETIPPHDTPPPAAVPPTDTANAAFQQSNLNLAAHEAALLSQMTKMMSMMHTGAAASSSISHQRDTCQSSGRSGRSNACSGCRGSCCATPTPCSYCWSHGACAHSSSQCNTQLPGHQSSATFTNMQGSSTNNCYWFLVWHPEPTIRNPLACMLPLTSPSPTVDSPPTPHVPLDFGATGTFVASADVHHLCHPLPPLTLIGIWEKFEKRIWEKFEKEIGNRNLRKIQKRNSEIRNLRKFEKEFEDKGIWESK
jgi:hypothetical protein